MTTQHTPPTHTETNSANIPGNVTTGMPSPHIENNYLDVNCDKCGNKNYVGHPCLPWEAPHTENEWETGKIYPLQKLYRQEEVDALLTQARTDCLREIREKVEGMRKKQLDKNDPDNYGACYAIGGFNDALNKVIALSTPDSK